MVLNPPAVAPPSSRQAVAVLGGEKYRQTCGCNTESESQRKWRSIPKPSHSGPKIFGSDTVPKRDLFVEVDNDEEWFYGPLGVKLRRQEREIPRDTCFGVFVDLLVFETWLNIFSTQGQNGSHFGPRPVPPLIPKKCDWDELDYSNGAMIEKDGNGGSGNEMPGINTLPTTISRC
ncbi:hypothetical protein Rs2_35270 [Raphanus sativus]|nr:hypothetical protein Rs2_35270 [Raphanus sativus]